MIVRIQPYSATGNVDDPALFRYRQKILQKMSIKVSGLRFYR